MPSNPLVRFPLQLSVIVELRRRITGRDEAACENGG
jgi:hypothetical protein